MKPLTQDNLDADIAAGFLPDIVIEKCQELLDVADFFPKQSFEILPDSPLSIETLGTVGYGNTTFNIESSRVVFFYHYDPELKHIQRYKNAIWGKLLSINGYKIYYYIPFNQGYVLRRFSNYDVNNAGLERRTFRLPPFNIGPECYFLNMNNGFTEMIQILSEINLNLLLLSDQ
jgi:hypothetical protein